MKEAIKKRVYETYPVTDKEKKCAPERRKRQYQRVQLRKRLIAEQKEKMEYK